MNKKLLAILFLSLMIINTLSAQVDSFNTIEKNKPIRLAQVCNGATSINITSISYPNSSIAEYNLSMIQSSDGEFYYIFSLTSQLGRYDVRGIANGCERTFSYYFYVNENGDEFDISQSFTLLGQFGIIALFFAMGITFGKDKWKLRSFFFMCSLLMGVIFLNSIRIFIGSSNNLSVMGNLGLILGIVVLSFMFLYLMINYTIEVFQSFQKKKREKWSVQT